LEPFVARATIDNIVTIAAEEGIAIIIAVGIERIVARAAKEPIRIGATVERVVAFIPVEIIAAITAIDDVIAGTTMNFSGNINLKSTRANSLTVHREPRECTQGCPRYSNRIVIERTLNIVFRARRYCVSEISRCSIDKTKSHHTFATYHSELNPRCNFTSSQNTEISVKTSIEIGFVTTH